MSKLVLSSSNCYTFKNHFNGKHTYMLGDYINNGCQTFHIKNIDSVCEEHDVPFSKKLEVLELYNRTPKLTDQQYIDAYNSFCTSDIERILILENGHCLDLALESNKCNYREVVASKGYKLDVLINDVSLYVRTKVAEQGYGLDKLVSDVSLYVRTEVAEQGYGLDVLVNDESSDVRRAVAGHNIPELMEILIKDVCWYVRAGVALQGYRLDILMNDNDSYVANIARNKFNEKGN